MAKIILIIMGVVMFTIGSVMLSMVFDTTLKLQDQDRRILVWMGLSWIVIAIGYVVIIFNTFEL